MTLFLCIAAFFGGVWWLKYKLHQEEIDVIISEYLKDDANVLYKWSTIGWDKVKDILSNR